MRLAKLGFFSRLAAAWLLLLGALHATWRCVRFPGEFLIMRDRLEAPIVRILVRHGALEEVIATNSAWNRQPLWMRDGSVRVSMIWYSENTKWIWSTGVDDPEPELPPYRYMAVGTHWVWSEAHARWLRKLGHRGVIHVVGPILWYLQRPRPYLSHGERKSIWVTVFDITPMSQEAAAANGLIDNYYSAERCIRFIRDIVLAVERVRDETGQDVRIRVKHKRFRSDAEPRYAREIDSLVEGDRIELTSVTDDLFQLILDSCLSVVQPFSSPALVASNLGSRVCYHDATGLLRRPDSLDPRIELTHDQESLREFVRTVVGEYAANDGRNSETFR